MSMKYSEEDIIRTINYLKIHHPDRATREGAIKLLDDMQGAAKDFVKTLTKLGKKERSKAAVRN